MGPRSGVRNGPPAMSGFAPSPRLYRQRQQSPLTLLGRRMSYVASGLWAHGISLPEMRQPQKCLVFVAIASLACAIGPRAAQPDPMVWVRSHNKSEVDVYLVCGNRDAKWIGLVPPKGRAAFELAAERRRLPIGNELLPGTARPGLLDRTLAAAGGCDHRTRHREICRPFGGSIAERVARAFTPL